MTQTAIIADVGAEDVEFTFAVSSSQKEPLGSEVSGTTELIKFVCTLLREYCRQAEAEVISYSSNKLHQTTYKEFF